MKKTPAKIVTIEGAQIPSMSRFYPFIRRELQFPEHFGQNLDALLDCLCDLSHLEVSEVVMRIQDAEKFLSKTRRSTRQVVWDIFEEATKPENRYDAVQFRVEKA